MGNGEDGMNIDLTEAIGAGLEADLVSFLEQNCLTREDVLDDASDAAAYRVEIATIVEAAAPIIAKQVAEFIAAAIEAEADRRASKRDVVRAKAIELRKAGDDHGHDAFMRTALSLRSEATGLWDAAWIAHEVVQ